MNVILHTGGSGAGKTYAMRTVVWRAVRARRHDEVIVLDRLRDWTTAPRDVASLAAQCRDATAAIAEKRRVRIVSSSRDDARDEAVRVAEWALGARRARVSRAVVISEAYRAAPSGGKLPWELEEIACAGRHYDATLYCDVQRPSMLHCTLREQAATWRAFATYSPDDLALFRSIGGRDLAIAIQKCGEELQNGAPGYHVELGPARLPPFVPVRFA